MLFFALFHSLLDHWWVGVRRFVVLVPGHESVFAYSVAIVLNFSASDFSADSGALKLRRRTTLRRYEGRIYM